MSYETAFYELAAMLGIPAQTQSPGTVWRDQMKPALQKLIDRDKIAQVAARLNDPEEIAADRQHEAWRRSMIAAADAFRDAAHSGCGGVMWSEGEAVRIEPQALEARQGRDAARGSIAEGDDIAVREADAPNTGETHAQ